MQTIFGKAYLQTATPEKPIRGFEVTGIWSYNRTVFKPEDFAAANVTEEDMPATGDCFIQPAALSTQAAEVTSSVHLYLLPQFYILTKHCQDSVYKLN